MKQLTMFENEIKIARKLLKADYALCLAVLKLTYSHSIAILILSSSFKAYYFSISRHNQMIRI